MPEGTKHLRGEVVAERHVIVETDLNEALIEQKSNNKSPDKILADNDNASPSHLLSAISLKHGHGTSNDIKGSSESIFDRLKKIRIPIIVKMTISITLVFFI